MFLFQVAIRERISRINLNDVGNLTYEQRKALKPLIDQVNVIKNKDTVTAFSKMFTSEATELPNIKLALSPAEISEIKKVLKGFGYDFSMTPETDQDILGAWESKYSGMDNGAVKFSEWANNPHAGTPSIRKGKKPIEESTPFGGGPAPEGITTIDMDKQNAGIGSFIRTGSEHKPKQPVLPPKQEDKKQIITEKSKTGESEAWIKDEVFTLGDNQVSPKWTNFTKSLSAGDEKVKMEKFVSSKDTETLKENFTVLAKENGYVMEKFSHVPAKKEGSHTFDIQFVKLEKANFDIDGVPFNKKPTYKVGELLKGEEVTYNAEMEKKIGNTDKTRKEALLELINERSMQQYNYAEGYPTLVKGTKSEYKVKLELLIRGGFKIDEPVKTQPEREPTEPVSEEQQPPINQPEQPPAAGIQPAVPGTPSGPSAGLSLGFAMGSKQVKEDKKKAESLSEKELQKRILGYKEKIMGAENKTQFYGYEIPKELKESVKNNELTLEDSKKISKELDLFTKLLLSNEQMKELKAGNPVRLDKSQLKAANKPEDAVASIAELSTQLGFAKIGKFSISSEPDEKGKLQFLEINLSDKAKKEESKPKDVTQEQIRSTMKKIYDAVEKGESSAPGIDEKTWNLIKDKVTIPTYETYNFSWKDGAVSISKKEPASAESDLDKVKKEIKKVDKQIKELTEKEGVKPKVTVEDSKKFYKDIGLSPEKQDYFFGSVAFGSSSVKEATKSFNTGKSMEDLKLYLSPAISYKLKGRPGVTDVEQQEWKEDKDNGKFSMNWLFKVNNKDHSLSLSIDKPNEKGYRKVTLLFN